MGIKKVIVRKRKLSGALGLTYCHPYNHFKSFIRLCEWDNKVWIVLRLVQLYAYCASHIEEGAFAFPYLLYYLILYLPPLLDGIEKTRWYTLCIMQSSSQTTKKGRIRSKRVDLSLPKLYCLPSLDGNTNSTTTTPNIMPATNPIAVDSPKTLLINSPTKNIKTWLIILFIWLRYLMVYLFQWIGIQEGIIFLSHNLISASGTLQFF